MEKVKGEANGYCNRGACQTEERVVFYHRLNHNYYCQECARRISDANMDWDGKPLCFYDVEADIVYHMDLGKEYRDPAKYAGDEENREITQEHIFSCMGERKYLYIRGQKTVERYRKFSGGVVREGDIVNVADVVDVTFNAVLGTLRSTNPYRDRYPTPPRPTQEPESNNKIDRIIASLDKIKKVAEEYDLTIEDAARKINNTESLRERMRNSPKDFIGMIGMPSSDHHILHDYIMRQAREKPIQTIISCGDMRRKIINPQHISVGYDVIEPRVLAGREGKFIIDDYQITREAFPCPNLSEQTKARLKRKGQNVIIGTPKDEPMPDDGESKLDYKARYKRIGDMVRDTVTGKLIPVRTCPKDIKRALGIR